MLESDDANIQFVCCEATDLQLEIDGAYSNMFSGLVVSFEESTHEDVTLGNVDEHSFVTLGKEDPMVESKHSK